MNQSIHLSTYLTYLPCPHLTTDLLSCLPPYLPACLPTLPTCGWMEVLAYVCIYDPGSPPPQPLPWPAGVRAAQPPSTCRAALLPHGGSKPINCQTQTHQLSNTGDPCDSGDFLPEGIDVAAAVEAAPQGGAATPHHRGGGHRTL